MIEAWILLAIFFAGVAFVGTRRLKKLEAKQAEYERWIDRGMDK